MACRIFNKWALGLFFHVECRWVLSEPLPYHYSVIIPLLHHTEMYSELDFFFSFIVSSEVCLQMYRWYCFLIEYINTPECLYWGGYWGGSIFAKDEGCICFFSFLLVHLNSYEGGMNFCCSVLYPFSSVLWSQWLSYVADFPKCIECANKTSYLADPKICLQVSPWSKCVGSLHF